MRVAQLRSDVAAADLRLDARFHTERASGGLPPPPGRPVGAFGRATWPARQRLALAAEDEESVPYLRPYDIFDYLPAASERVSAKRYAALASYRVAAGMILQTCSGRNLGPSAIADAHLAQFIVSNDLIRLTIHDEDDRLATAAYLRTSTGMAALRRGRSGSVIDHIAPSQVEALVVPDLPTDVRAAALGAMRDAVSMRESGRVELAALIREVEQAGPAVRRERRLREGFTAMSTSLEGRLDAAPQDPLVLAVIDELRAAGVPSVDDLADVRKPQGRYRPRYVGGAYGQPYLSGRQVLQSVPVNLRHVAASSLPDSSRFELGEWWIVYQADGRADEGLGTPSVVVPARMGWFASGHVGRVVAREGVSFGALYLGLAAWQAQVQIRSLASGSVVDSTFEWDMGRVLLPAVTAEQVQRSEAAWAQMNQAEVAEASAIQAVERWLAQASEGLL